MSNNSDEPISR